MAKGKPKLNPCPFCGGKAKLENQAVYRLPMYWASCRKCYFTQEPYPHPQDAIAAWNRRAGEKGEKP